MTDGAGPDQARPPSRISLLWCPVCGHNDRWTHMSPHAGRHFAGGKKCHGQPRKLEYRIPHVPEPPPGLNAGTFRAAVAVELAIRPGLPHLSDGPISFVGRTVLFNVNSADEVGAFARLVLHDIAAKIPDQVAAHPRPEPKDWMPR